MEDVQKFALQSDLQLSTARPGTSHIGAGDERALIVHPKPPNNQKMGDVAAVEETFKRVQSHKGVIGVMVINADGIAIRTTFDNDVTVQYAALVSHFTVKSRSVVRKLDGENELQFLRIRSKKHEIMIAPDFDKNNEYYLVVVQDPSTE